MDSHAIEKLVERPLLTIKKGAHVVPCELVRDFAGTRITETAGSERDSFRSCQLLDMVVVKRDSVWIEYRKGKGAAALIEILGSEDADDLIAYSMTQTEPLLQRPACEHLDTVVNRATTDSLKVLETVGYRWDQEIVDRSVLESGVPRQERVPVCVLNRHKTDRAAAEPGSLEFGQCRLADEQRCRYQSESQTFCKTTSARNRV